MTRTAKTMDDTDNNQSHIVMECGLGDCVQLPPTAGVYAIIHTRTNRMYVGSSVNIRQRIISHLGELCLGAHHSYRLQRAFIATPGRALDFHVRVLQLMPGATKDELIQTEQQLINSHHSAAYGVGFNVAKDADYRHVKSIGSERHWSMTVKGVDDVNG